MFDKCRVLRSLSEVVEFCPGDLHHLHLWPQLLQSGVRRAQWSDINLPLPPSLPPSQLISTSLAVSPPLSQILLFSSPPYEEVGEGDRVFHYNYSTLFPTLVSEVNQSHNNNNNNNNLSNLSLPPPERLGGRAGLDPHNDSDNILGWQCTGLLSMGIL